MKKLLLIAALALASTPAFGVQLVTDQAIKAQKDLTSVHKLKNGIPVIIRRIPGSDIVQLNVSFASGLKDLPVGKKALNDWFWDVLPLASKSYSRDKVFSLTEKYSLELGCGGGIEVASCGLGTINDYWKESLPLFADLINHPSMNDQDVKLTKDRLVARLRNTPSDPGGYINEIVNSVYYPVGHPYRLNHDEALVELDKLGKQDLVDYHKNVLNAAAMSIVFVGSLPEKQILADLEKAFGKIAKAPVKVVTPLPPPFDPAKSFIFKDRELPTAYIRIKLNAPSILDKDAVATKLLFEILSEELGDLIRTKRSLSYAVHAFAIQYSLGIGVLSASTSKPKETLEAMHEVLEQIKTKAFTAEEIEEYKHVFATSYYQTQETHASLAGALSSAYHFFKNPNEHYELPRKLDKVTAEDIKRLANDVLNDLRVGVIFGRKNFEDSWAQDLIKKNLASDKKADKS
jgi:zinc protease